MLELLCFEDLVKHQDAEAAVRALHDSVMWVYLSTGPEAHLHEGERRRLYELVKRREELKEAEGGVKGAKSEELAAVRAECAQLIKAWKKTGYKYTGAVYREIAMENSDVPSTRTHLTAHPLLLCSASDSSPLPLRAVCVDMCSTAAWRMWATPPSCPLAWCRRRCSPTPATCTWRA